MANRLNKNEIVENILRLTIAAIKQTNKNAVFSGPMSEDWDYFSVLNAVHSGELAIKAIIANEHPLLIFKDLFSLYKDDTELTLQQLMLQGKSHDLNKLPQVLWAVTGQTIASKEIFKKAVSTRNIIQHFLSPTDTDLGYIALDFLYTVVDPLLVENFKIYPIKYHDNPDDYGYLIQRLIYHEIRFSMTQGFRLDYLEGDSEVALTSTSKEYQAWFQKSVANANS